MVQRWTTHWVQSDYHWNNSVTAMLCDLRCVVFTQFTLSRSVTFYNPIYNNSVLIIPDYFMTTTTAACHQHLLHFVTPSMKTIFYKFIIVFPRTIQDWNNLPIETIESPSLNIISLVNNDDGDDDSTLARTCTCAPIYSGHSHSSR